MLLVLFYQLWHFLQNRKLSRSSVPRSAARTLCANSSRRPWCGPGKCQSSIGVNRQSAIDNRESLSREAICCACRLLLAATPTNTLRLLAREVGEGRREKREGRGVFPFFVVVSPRTVDTIWLLASRIEHGTNFEPIYLCLLNFAAINSTLSCVPAVCCLVSAPCHWTPFPCLLAD